MSYPNDMEEVLAGKKEESQSYQHRSFSCLAIITVTLCQWKNVTRVYWVVSKFRLTIVLMCMDWLFFFLVGKDNNHITELLHFFAIQCVPYNNVHLYRTLITEHDCCSSLLFSFWNFSNWLTACFHLAPSCKPFDWIMPPLLFALLYTNAISINIFRSCV